MRRHMVNLVEFAHVVDLLGRYAPQPVIDKALRTAQIDRDMVAGGKGFVPYSAEAIVLESVARAIGDRHLGARLGRDFDYSTYGAYADFVLGAPDLATALDRGRRALLCTHPGSEIVLRETDSHIVVGRSSEGLSVVGHRHLDEGALFVIADVARHFLGPEWRPDWVEIPGATARSRSELGDMMDAPVRSGARMPAVAIRKADLGTRNPSRSGPGKTLSLDAVTALMGVAPTQTMQEAVLHVFRVHADSGLPASDVVARHLALGPRTLQRALAREGTTFRKVRAQSIETAARAMLAETDLPIDDIAKALGYAEPRSFRRAFKLWTGQSPQAYRIAHRTRQGPLDRAARPPAVAMRPRR